MQLMYLWCFVCFVVIAMVLVIFGHKEDKGYSASQRLIRCWFRMARWTLAQARGWDAFLFHYREAVTARQREILATMSTPLPELRTPRRTKSTEITDASVTPIDAITTKVAG